MLEWLNNLKFVPSGWLGLSPLILPGNLNSQGAPGKKDEVPDGTKGAGSPYSGGLFLWPLFN